MTRAKAIEFLRFLLKEHPRIESADFGSALKLGTEALAYIEKWRDQLIEQGFSPLPGEDSQ